MPIERIAILSVHTSPTARLGGKKVGGMNVYIRELARELANRGIQVDIFTRYTTSDAAEIDTSLGTGVRVVHVQAGPAIALEPDAVYDQLSHFAAGVIAYAIKHHVTYDLIYSHYWLSGWVAHKLDEVWNVPVVHMFHTLGHMKHRIGAGPLAMPDTRVRVETQVLDWADRIVAATPAEEAQLLWLYRADRRKIAIVPPGVDSSRFQPVPRAEAKAVVDVPADKDLLLFVGRLEPLKAVDTILEAVGLIRSSKPDALDDVVLAIIGGDLANPSDTELARLYELTHHLGLGDVVQFLGAKDHQLLPYYYAASTAVIMPSDYESFGMVALEAMATGTPVIATEVGGLAFLVRDSETGYLVPVRDPAALADGIMALLHDPERREALSRNAARVAQTYSWSNIVDRLLTIFEAAIAQRRPWVLNRRKR